MWGRRAGLPAPVGRSAGALFDHSVSSEAIADALRRHRHFVAIEALD
jgi:hypothetical protein